MAKILLVEDNPDLSNVVRTFLLFEHHQVELLDNGAEANDHLKTFDYDLIVLDWELPGLHGIEVLKAFRSRGGKTPVLMLTGKKELDDKELGLDSGADDYLTKPFEMRELAARVRALLRRPKSGQESNTLVAGDIRMDVSKHRVVKGEQSISLVPKEFQLLEFLLRNQNHVFTPEALLNRVWPSDSEATLEALRTTIKRVRKKVDPDGKILRTVYGVGYILEAE